MNQKLLYLTSTCFLCPYCGKWHEWDEKYTLEYYDSGCCQVRLKCANSPDACNYDYTKIIKSIKNKIN